MKKFNISIVIIVFIFAMLLAGCASWSKTQKGAVIGTAAGGGVGTIIGKASGNTALGTIIGAAVGGATGAVIGHQMDKQAEDIKKAVPDAKVERVGEGIVVEFSSKVLFGFDESVLSYSAQKNLDDLVLVLNSYIDTDIELQGHTDSKGSIAYNQALSERRARAVSSYLNSKGIAFNRLTIKGFGEEEPKYDNTLEGGREQNRRVEFLITANAKMKAEAANASN
jgi:outer membrane protein OmpA-like peptidoglycan-associated protein